jgi:Asp-tRNA(Asn)/Glu-tRNA(Gln) amidotransferase A subunit family amidase
VENFYASWLVLNKLNQKVLSIIGNDTGGSVRVLASYCGILGFRPSQDAISTAGVIPMAQSFDTVGKEPTI